MLTQISEGSILTITTGMFKSKIWINYALLNFTQLLLQFKLVVNTNLHKLNLALSDLGPYTKKVVAHIVCKPDL